MWGQGLARSDRFTFLAAQQIAATAGKNVAAIVWDYSRSGAKITTTQEDLENFHDTFFEIFQNQLERNTFLAGDQQFAHNLYGEIPADCPSIKAQARLLDAKLGRTVDLALICGGGNDMGLDNLLDPDNFEGTFAQEMEGKIASICGTNTRELLGLVRDKCPRAIIVFVGYFPIFSHESSLQRLLALARYRNKNDVLWAINKRIGWQNVDGVIKELQVRAIWALGRAGYYQARTVRDANADDALRGPGLLYVPSGMRPSNAMFAPQRMIWDDYAAPATDPAQTARMAHCLRLAELPTYTAWATLMGLPNMAQVKRARQRLTGPVSLLPG